MTPNAVMTDVIIDGVGVVEPQLQQVLAAPIVVVTPAGSATRWEESRLPFAIEGVAIG